MSLAQQLEEAGLHGLRKNVVMRLDSPCAKHTGGKTPSGKLTAKVAFWKDDQFWDYAHLKFGVVQRRLVLGNPPGTGTHLCPYFRNLNYPRGHFKHKATGVDVDKNYVAQILSLDKRPADIGRHLVSAPDFGDAFIALPEGQLPTAPSLALDRAMLEAAANPELLGDPELFPVLAEEAKFGKAWSVEDGVLVEVVTADGAPRQLHYPPGSVPLYRPGEVVAGGPLCSLGPKGEYKNTDEYEKALRKEWASDDLLNIARQATSLSAATPWRYKGTNYRLFKAAWHPGDITQDNLVFDISKAPRLQIFPNPGSEHYFSGRSRCGLVDFFLWSEEREDELKAAVRQLRREEREQEKEQIKEEEQLKEESEEA